MGKTKLNARLALRWKYLWMLMWYPIGVEALPKSGVGGWAAHEGNVFLGERKGYVRVRASWRCRLTGLD